MERGVRFMAKMQGDADDFPYEALLARGLGELRLLTAAHERMWQISEADWSADLEAGTILFSSCTFREPQPCHAASSSIRSAVA